MNGLVKFLLIYEVNIMVAIHNKMCICMSSWVNWEWLEF